MENKVVIKGNILELVIDEANLVVAVKMGLISWFEFFERWRKLENKKQ